MGHAPPDRKALGPEAAKWALPVQGDGAAPYRLAGSPRRKRQLRGSSHKATNGIACSYVARAYRLLVRDGCMTALRPGRVVVLGATGQIGSALMARMREIIPEPGGVIGTSRAPVRGDRRLAQFDLADGRSNIPVSNLGADDTVVLLAAVADPNKAFASPEAAYAVNVDGAARVVSACQESGARLVFFSSVEVFDGLDGPFGEHRPARPLNVYGKTKAQIESLIRSRMELDRYCIVRTPWNVGHEPSPRCVVKMTYGSLLSTGARMAVDNQLSLIDLRDTVVGVASLLTDFQEFPAPTLHLASPDSLTRVQLADLVRAESLYGSKMTFERIQFAQLNLTEPRGLDVRLDSSLSRDLLGMRYRPAAETIGEKVRLLDQWMKAGVALDFN